MARGGKQVELAFQAKMNIAIGIAQGIRYMHEECPRGPIVHGDLRPCNIHLTSDLHPLISGFGRAKWLQLEQASPIFVDRYSDKDHSDNDLLALIKSDILSFGILLLRLFCKRSAPQDDKFLVEWVISFLRGETSCAVQSSPSSEGSPNLDSNAWTN
ncbi:hypothetical protein F0562_000822 [Nyssa sinensis]|uniref:Protein kinase domain-containing protein n=1 Tax=Nyssa sinensis TaxID=561372 RepID=A0A5J5C1J1_9ASTE|nr:hypothetical protein F0562_000822 [Nyssa sinensis]